MNKGTSALSTFALSTFDYSDGYEIVELREEHQGMPKQDKVKRVIRLTPNSKNSPIEAIKNFKNSISINDADQIEFYSEPNILIEDSSIEKLINNNR